VVDAVNFALAQLGSRQRFIALEPNGQCPELIFAEAEKFLPIAHKYHLPLGDDHAAAMRAGKEYERHVIARYAQESEEERE
jgi:hypothetical protein